MGSVKEIEEAVEQLSAKELASFRSWFADYDSAQWDVDIEKDITSGRLDSIAEEALTEYRSGGAREI